MNIEEIAQIDAFLRQQQGTQNILDLDALIVTKDSSSVLKLKEAAQRLNLITTPATEEIKHTWKNLFTQQVKYSVTRAKTFLQKETSIK